MNITQEGLELVETPANHPPQYKDPLVEFDMQRRREAGLPEVEDMKLKIEDVDLRKSPPVLKESFVTITFFQYNNLLETETKWNKFKASFWYKI